MEVPELLVLVILWSELLGAADVIRQPLPSFGLVLFCRSANRVTDKTLLNF